MAKPTQTLTKALVTNKWCGPADSSVRSENASMYRFSEHGQTYFVIQFKGLIDSGIRYCLQCGHFFLQQCAAWWNYIVLLESHNFCATLLWGKIWSICNRTPFGANTLVLLKLERSLLQCHCRNIRLTMLNCNIKGNSMSTPDTWRVAYCRFLFSLPL